jgi:hypothetical protein
MKWRAGLAALTIGCLATALSAQTTPSAATRPATAPVTTAPVDPTTPKGALKSLAQALDAGDRSAVLNLLSASSPQEQKIADATADLAVATAALRRAAIKSFGEQASRALGVDLGATPEAMARIDAARVELDGDKATVRTAEAEGPPMVLVRRDGAWRLQVALLIKDVEAADIERSLHDVADQTRLLRELTAEVIAGKFKTAAEARETLDKRILKSAMPEIEPASHATTTPAPTNP